jgi:hypothetical protein
MYEMDVGCASAADTWNVSVPAEGAVEHPDAVGCEQQAEKQSDESAHGAPLDSMGPASPIVPRPANAAKRQDCLPTPFS